MAEKAEETTEAPEPTESTEPSDAAKGALKGLIREVLDEWAKDNSPPPARTTKPTRNIFNDILSYGSGK